jgi:hypothetical protein
MQDVDPRGALRRIVSFLTGNEAATLAATSSKFNIAKDMFVDLWKNWFEAEFPVVASRSTVDSDYKQLFVQSYTKKMSYKNEYSLSTFPLASVDFLDSWMCVDEEFIVLTFHDQTQIWSTHNNVLCFVTHRDPY